MNELAIVWMSAGNSYFTESRVSKLLTLASRFEKVIIVSPSMPAEHTFLALGYSPSEAKRKATLNANLLKNRAKKILATFKDKSKFSFVDWKEHIKSEHYLQYRQEIEDLYANNPGFRTDARTTTKKVIEGKAQSQDVEPAINEAVKYLLDEFAFILSCPAIYQVRQVVYLYHRPWEIYEHFIAGKYDGKKQEELQFQLTRIE